MTQYMKNKVTGQIMRRERVVGNSSEWIEFKIARIPYIDKSNSYVKQCDRITLEKQVKDELAKPLTMPVKQMNFSGNFLTKKEWRELRTKHGMKGISRKQTLELLGE